MSTASDSFGPGARAATMAAGALLLAGCLPTLGFYSLGAVITVGFGTVAALLAVLCPGACDRGLATVHGRRALRALGPVLLLLSAYHHALDAQPSRLVAPLGLLAFGLLVAALLGSPKDETPLRAVLPGLLIWSPAAALLETRLMYVEVPAGSAAILYGWLTGLMLACGLAWCRRETRLASGLVAALLLLGVVVRGGAIIASPSPVIDVYALLEQRPRDLLRGENPYTAALASPYRTPRAVRFRVATMDADDDPPWYPPGFLLLGVAAKLVHVDPRWWLPLAWTVAALAAARWGRRSGRPREAGLIAGCLALLPSASFTAEQSWMDPVWVVLMAASLAPLAPVAAGALAGLGLTVKQTAMLVLPAVVLRWRGERRVAAVALGVAAAVCLPFVLWSPAAFFSDCLLGFLARDLPATGLCVPAAFLNLTGWAVPTLPLTLLGATAAVGLAWGARDSRPRLVAAAGAGVAVFSVLNKYAFMNFYEAATLLLYLGAAWPARAEGEA